MRTVPISTSLGVLAAIVLVALLARQESVHDQEVLQAQGVEVHSRNTVLRSETRDQKPFFHPKRISGKFEIQYPKKIRSSRGPAIGPRLAVAADEPLNPAFSIEQVLPEPVIAEKLRPDEPVAPALLEVKSSSVIRPINIAGLAALRKGDPVSFPTPEGGWISGKVQYLEAETSSSRLTLAGILAERPGHQFSIFVNDGEMSASHFANTDHN